MAAYLCVASNGVPPSISKRVQVKVQCKQKEIMQFVIKRLIFPYSNSSSNALNSQSAGRCVCRSRCCTWMSHRSVPCLHQLLDDRARNMIISGNERGDDECLLMRNFSFIICAHLQIPRGRAINLRQSPRIADIASIWNWKSETLVQMTLGIIAVWQKILSVCRNIMVVIREYWFLSFKFSRLFSLHRWNGWHDKTGWWARHMKN